MIEAVIYALARQVGFLILGVAILMVLLGGIIGWLIGAYL